MDLFSRNRPLWDFLQRLVIFSLVISYISLAGADDQSPLGVAPVTAAPKRVAVIGKALA